MNKKEMQEEIEYLRTKLDYKDKELSEYKEKELSEYKEKERQEMYGIADDKSLLQQVNRDYLEIIRWHTNKESAVIQPSIEFDQYGNKLR